MEDVLEYYSKVTPYLKKFLKDKEIATKTHINSFTIIKRGSKNGPLYIEDLIKYIDKKFFGLRNKNHLKEVKENLDEKQIRIWTYFVPRKLVEFFYSTNGEGRGREIDRIYLDVDRTNLPAEMAQKATKELVETLKRDKDFNKSFKNKLFVMWTGSSFHVYILLKNKIKNSIYTDQIAYRKSDPLHGFIGRWIEDVKNKTKIKIIGGHKKLKNHIVVDPSQTPSGKLGRVPFSIHVKDNKIDGIALPLAIGDLDDKNMVKKLKKYTPEKVLKEIEVLSNKLP